MIVSVFPIESDIQVVVVEPIPTMRDLEGIKEYVKIIVNKEPKKQPSKLEPSELRRDDSEAISQEILLKGFEISHEILKAFTNEIDGGQKSAFILRIFLWYIVSTSKNNMNKIYIQNYITLK
ncbi:hypothetical protein [Bacillus sp. AFS041924]|uniref:hypothetical protein n=1 Tax=Bacillus sp. AFS041924 TaxID=2033503 RepID=UPI000BFE10BE|nr:hypothetical protein [Bacillus sp. AFS041924]PGS54248.1 hypothetical protein COC46_05950 [Bacillus sp. AFS041924]